MIRTGEYNQLQVNRMFDFGAYLTDGKDDVLLPKRFMPEGLKVNDTITVFIYHDSENRLIATTQHPKGVVGDIVLLKAVANTPQGAFLDWGLMKDIFVPKTKQKSRMLPGADYLVKIYIDEQTGRVAATEKIDFFLNNDILTVKEKDEVELTVYRRTEVGYAVIINNQHIGLLHFNEVYRDIQIGDKFKGFIKTIREENKIDVAAGTSGYKRVEDEGAKIMRLLHENKGFLPYHDKSPADDIYGFFGMSKKTFKMTTGSLFKQRKIEFKDNGIQLTENQA